MDLNSQAVASVFKLKNKRLNNLKAQQYSDMHVPGNAFRYLYLKSTGRNIIFGCMIGFFSKA